MTFFETVLKSRLNNFVKETGIFVASVKNKLSFIEQIEQGDILTMILAVTNRKEYELIFRGLGEWDYEIKVVRVSEFKEVSDTAGFDMVFMEIGNADAPFKFKAVKESFPCLPIIGIAKFSKIELKRYLADQGLFCSDFANIIFHPLNLKNLVFAVEEVIALNEENPADQDESISEKDIQNHLSARRRPMEDKRISGFLANIEEEELFEL